ncbi:MAG TPA: glycosyltransferase family 39 protein [Candidatus Polarisedimenticolia bacterium]|nr:glycosyltransferase family 39 protein [Candidatus Polarisedimenticolia bacterium]
MPPEVSRRWEWKWVLGLLALALALRAGFVLFEQPGFYFEDSLDYDLAARTLLQAGHFDAKYYRFPLYPVVMAATYKVFGDGLTPLRILQSLIGTGTCFFVWLVGRHLFGPRAALLALFGAAVFPVHVVLAGIEYPVVLGMFFLWAAFAALVRTQPGGRSMFPALILAGGGVALSALLFEGGIVGALFLLLWLLLGKRFRGARLPALAAAGLAALVILSPWIYEMKRNRDYRALVLRPGIHLPSAPGVNPPVWAGSGENLLSSKVSGLARNPKWTLRHAWAEFLHFWNPYPDRIAAADRRFREHLHEKDPRMALDNALVGDQPRLLYAVVFSLLLLAALAGALMAPHAVPGSVFLVAWPVLLGVCYSPFFTQMRYRIPADPAFILLGAYALDRAWGGTFWSELRASLKALWEGWKRVATKIAVVQTFIILFLLFAVVLGPIALLMKIFRKDPMHAPQAAGSFWALRERTREGMQECVKQF